jgi:hypothetical protein
MPADRQQGKADPMILSENAEALQVKPPEEGGQMRQVKSAGD